MQRNMTVPKFIETAKEKYHFLAKLGSNQLADVYLGIEKDMEEFGRLLVIKRIHSLWVKTPSDLRRFKEICQTLSRIQHPNIAKIYDVCRMGNDICLVTEYISGETLEYIWKAARKRNLAIPLPIVCRLILEACDAFHHAHTHKTDPNIQLNLIHRDNGPQNLMIDCNGYLKVVDFGTANFTTQSDRTCSGMIKGKFNYLAPDLFKYEKLDHRLDLYSLGLVFYELITRTLCYDFPKDVTLAEVVDRLTKGELKAPSKIVPFLPKKLDAIIAKATASDRNQRYPSTKEFSTDIRRLAERSGGLPTDDQMRDWFNATFKERVARRQEFERLALKKYAQQMMHKTSQTGFLTNNATVNISQIHQLRKWRGEKPKKKLGGNPTKHTNPYLFLLTAFGLLVFAVVLFHQLFWKPSQEALEPKPSKHAALEQNNLHVLSNPLDAHIFIDGKLVGTTATGSVNLRIVPGKEHTLLLRKEGFEDYRAQVVGSSFALRRIEATLVPKTSRKRFRRKRKPKERMKTQSVERKQKSKLPSESAPTE
jgi:serine/threonine protein kinase